MKHLIAILVMTLFSCSSFAFRDIIQRGSLTINPVIGYERVQKIFPTPHSTSRLIYGLRAQYGVSLLSLEAEATQGRSDETFPVEGITVKDTTTNLKLGLRSNFNVLANTLSMYLRAGGSANKTKEEITENGVTRVNKPSLKISPYAGTGFNFRLLSSIYVNGGITVIFTGEPKGSDYDYQTTLGFTVRI